MEEASASRPRSVNKSDAAARWQQWQQSQQSQQWPPGHVTDRIVSALNFESLLSQSLTHQQDEFGVGAKELRDRGEPEVDSSIHPPQVRTASGLVNTDVIQLAGPAGRKRVAAGISRSNVPETNRDARTAPARDEADGRLRPARKFGKFVDFDLSTMSDTKGGFLGAEDEPAGKGAKTVQDRPAHMTAADWERLQLIKKLQRTKEGPYQPGISGIAGRGERRKCRECGKLEIDHVWEEVFACAVCAGCKDKFPDKYSLLTKTECKEDYLLTDPELKDADLLPHLSKPNPHKPQWHDMMLFLRYQVEEYAFGRKWGSPDALDAEFARRETDKKRRKEAKFKEKLQDLKRKTRTEAFRRNNARTGAAMGARTADVGNDGKHVHDWGRTVENGEGATVKTCLSCGMEVEELEL